MVKAHHRMTMDQCMKVKVQGGRVMGPYKKARALR